MVKLPNYVSRFATLQSSVIIYFLNGEPLNVNSLKSLWFFFSLRGKFCDNLKEYFWFFLLQKNKKGAVTLRHKKRNTQFGSFTVEILFHRSARLESRLEKVVGWSLKNLFHEKCMQKIYFSPNFAGIPPTMRPWMVLLVPHMSCPGSELSFSTISPEKKKKVSRTCLEYKTTIKSISLATTACGCIWHSVYYDFKYLEWSFMLISLWWHRQMFTHRSTMMIEVTEWCIYGVSDKHLWWCCR